MKEREDPPRPLLKMALRCPKCREGNPKPTEDGAKMYCPKCGHETPSSVTGGYPQDLGGRC
jgi:Zn finger protein HypA/HybF involved in hydrogenase expression